MGMQWRLTSKQGLRLSKELKHTQLDQSFSNDGIYNWNTDAVVQLFAKATSFLSLGA
jgi:hypothetical protein